MGLNDSYMIQIKNPIPVLFTVAALLLSLGACPTIPPIQSDDVAAEYPEVKSEGVVGVYDTDLIYKGQGVKCYNVKFLKAEPEESIITLQVHVDGKHITNLQKKESTDVCGQIIKVRGYYAYPYPANHLAFWKSTELR